MSCGTSRLRFTMEGVLHEAIPSLSRPRMPAMKRCVVLLCLVTALAAAPARADPELYLVADLATQSDHAPVRAQARELEAIYDDLARASGVEAKLIYSTDPDINAFATEVGDEKIVVVQEGLLVKMGSDRDAVAATLGHELAHHKGDHIRAGRRKQEGVRVLGAILGAVVGARVGRNSGELAGALSGAAVGVGANLLALKFNRNQELEADRLAIGWMIQAGYNPQGMLRLQQQLGAMAGKRRAGILSTHPTSAKRYQAADKLIAKLAPADDLLARPVAPLVDADAIADATRAISDAEEERIAQVLKPEDEAPTAAALAPIDGIDFDTYAAVGNQLLYAGDGGKRQVLAKHRLDDAKLARLNADFTRRMQQDQALARHYSVAFFRASQGKLAAHGRDLADSFEKGQPLQLEPPYPMQTAKALLAAMQARGAPSLDAAQQAAAEAEVLRPHGLSYYDYLIGHNWWSRKVTVSALSGDSAPLQDYYSALTTAAPDADGTAEAEAEAEASGVHVGDNVKIGKNVRIGSKRAPDADDAGSQD
jgi:Zn-dependent protease with chaperone function